MEAVRYFQWVDDHGYYNSKSILSRLITRPTRVIRHEDTEEALSQDELDSMENLETVRVKWFVPVASGESFRLPARILPPVHTETECDIIKILKRLDLGEGDVDRKKSIITRVRQDPCGISRKIRERLNDYVPVNKRKRLKSMEIEIEEERLEAEIKVNFFKNFVFFCSVNYFNEKLNILIQLIFRSSKQRSPF